MEKKSIFKFQSYRDFLKNYLKSLPKSRGILKLWAQHLNVHSTLISQVMMGKRDFTEEQGLDLADFLGLSAIEKEYFLELLRMEKAGNSRLKSYHQSKLRELSARSLKLSERIDVDRKLTAEESAVFYSSWIYSAIRLSCSLGSGLTIEEILKRLSLPRARVLSALEFLRESGFVKQNGSRFEIGTQYTHLGKDSPFLSRHHANWRIKSLQRMDHLTEQELMYTAPFSISEKDFIALREQMVGVIQEFLKTVKASEGEMIACFNLDLFRVTD